MPVPANAVDKMIAKVKLNLGRVGDPTLTDYVIEWINDTQREVCNVANFWFMRANTTIAVTAGNLTNPLPADFKDEDGVYIEETLGWTELDWMDFLDYRRTYDDTTRAEPAHYVLDGSGNVLFRPVPDASYTIRLDYWKWLADMVAGGAASTLLNEHPDILEAGATYRGFRYLSELEDASAWQGIYQARLGDLRAQNVERELPDEFFIRTRPDVYGSGTGGIRNR